MRNLMVYLSGIYFYYTKLCIAKETAPCTSLTEAPSY